MPRRLRAGRRRPLGDEQAIFAKVGVSSRAELSARTLAEQTSATAGG